MKLLALIGLAATLTACGTNAFESTDAGDPSEDAVVALEKGDSSKAISVLEKALDKDPGNAQYLSILATAYAQRAGIDPLRFARTVAVSATGSSGESSVQAGELGTTFALLPSPTDQVLNDIDRAVEILVVDLDADAYLPGDSFKLGLFQTASFMLRSKRLDQNGDGIISPDEVVDLSDTSATGLLNQIDAAQATLEAQAETDPNAAKAAKALDQYSSQIDAQPGATREEKLANFLQAKTGSSQIPTTTPAQ